MNFTCINTLDDPTRCALCVLIGFGDGARTTKRKRAFLTAATLVIFHSVERRRTYCKPAGQGYISLLSGFGGRGSFVMTCGERMAVRVSLRLGLGLWLKSQTGAIIVAACHNTCPSVFHSVINVRLHNLVI